LFSQIDQFIIAGTIQNTNMKNKVLHIDTGFGWRGGQQQAVYLYEGLLEKGVDTLFYCKPNSKLETYFIDRGLPYKTEKLRNEVDILSARRIAKFAKENNYNILHLHTAHAISIGLFAKLFNPHLKLIGMRRVDFHINKNPFSKLKYTSNLLDCIVCISNAIKKIVIQDGIPEDKVKVIPSGIDIHKFDNANKNGLKTELGIPDSHLIVGTVAALVGHKDYPNLLKAAEKVIAKTENVSFCAAGSGAKEARIRSLANKLSLEGRFHFLGYRDDIGRVLKNYDIFVLASKKEGLGTSVLDAQSVGLPTVGTTAGGIPEMIENGSNGLLVQKEEPQSLADAILRLVRDKNLREDLGQKAISSVRNYSIKKNIRRNIALYNELLAKSK